VGAVAYKLELPVGSKIHSVVHVSRLKKHVSPSELVEEDIIQVSTDPKEVVQPIPFTATRMVRKGTSMIAQIQVRWSLLPSSMLTWEQENDLKRRYPRSPA